MGKRKKQRYVMCGGDREQQVEVELYYVLDDDGDGEEKSEEKGIRMDVLQRAWPASHVPSESMMRKEFIHNMTMVVFRGEVFDSGLIIVRNEADVRGGAKEIIKKPGVESPVGRIL